ncbi:MAG: type II toxin-antitoxin system HicA family toxin [Aggregatilineales bacterium]
MKRTQDSNNQYLTVPVHGKKSLSIKTLKSIYRQASQYILEDALNMHFYT